MRYSKERVLKALEDGKVICWADLYESLGITQFLLNLDPETKKYYDVWHILASQDFQQTVNAKLKTNILKSKDKRVKIYNKEGRERMWNWDCVCFSPTTAEVDTGIQLEINRPPRTVNSNTQADPQAQ